MKIVMLKQKSAMILLNMIFILATTALTAQNSALNQSHTFMGPISHYPIGFYISLPESYNNSAKNYPVIYYLHGMNEYFINPRTEQIINFFRNQSQAGTLPETILIFPDGKDGFWGDHYDNKTLLETNVIKEIIPHINQKFRTNNSLIILGWSAGGGAAINFYTKYPELFCGAASLDGAILNWKEMLYFQPEMTKRISNSDSVYYYNHFCPYNWIVPNNKSLRKDKNPALFLVASFFKSPHKTFLSLLKSEDIPVNYYELNCEHDFNCVFSQSQDKLATFLSGILEIPIQKK
ncbi:alpha/beta hydrolase-fold protein [Prolixibacteraceae bacterium Z1-6]|uniref:Alpha/beta hydrolase-fold protein n=1 Tax=Draconibacterium aestuarii TaxID=2998507 RepID=A0A9X3J3W1_9BACT|nr:alpha/beta hydrolase-fold protein [Prolixibacteraceae bacterium Z1-6]